MSVVDSLKSLHSYGLPIGKLLVVGLRPKWQSSVSRTCLYSLCECGRQPKITISVRTPYGKIVGSRVNAEMAIEFFPTYLYSVCECGRQPEITISVWASYAEVVDSGV